ncbi:hypothetical protein [Helicobacter sp. 11S03491-1]|uniref:hypothetical protein n=1 Tax=Helicobacter sp. 11S03491-1 TaxID=1476196 RepID=UPI000BD87DD4|nr:hypothetical protein [Helicobacter sp. 11S03491-1]PAF41705.1 hypothetical protein BKH45_06355 [Helicobacter sp. 11S03491-1]
MLKFPSPLQEYIWRGRKFYIKRDDLIHPLFNGNKARKFEGLLNLDMKILVSYGGNQSNGLATLSYIAKIKGCQFFYVTPVLSSFLEQFPQGNLALARENGVLFEYLTSKEHVNVNMLQKRALEISKSLGDGVQFIPQGGACEIARVGIQRLALELKTQMASLKNPIIFYVSGTGASSGYLSELIPNVFTTPSAGNEEYLKSLFVAMGIAEHPHVLSIHKKIPFAKPDDRLWEVYTEWLDLGIEFDLIYDCLGWLCIMEHLHDFTDNEIVFIHSGGTNGNLTQKERYYRQAGKVSYK